MTDARPDIRLVALDIDGTLLNPNHRISKANKQAIKAVQDKGITVVLSTGRAIRTCAPFAKELGLTSYLVTVNGGEIWDGAGKLIERNSLNLESVEMMWELTQHYGCHFWAVSTESVHRGTMPNPLSDYIWIKYGFDFENPETRDAMIEKLESHPELELSNSSPTNIEVNPRGVNKARGLEKVCCLLNLNLEHVMACGDSLNDLQMIKEVGLGVAMGNAQDEVKAAADWVTLTNEEDGVAFALEKWIL